MLPINKFWGFSHISVTTEPKVVKFCTQVGCINSSNRMVYHSQKGRGYGHVTVCRDAVRREGSSETAVHTAR